MKLQSSKPKEDKGNGNGNGNGKSGAKKDTPTGVEADKGVKRKIGP